MGEQPGSNSSSLAHQTESNGPDDTSALDAQGEAHEAPEALGVDQTRETAEPAQKADERVDDTSPAVASSTAPPSVSSAAQTGPEPQKSRLLPDPARWVVVADWNDQSPEGSTERSVQLDFAPIDDNGVPQLGQSVQVSYRSGRYEDLDRIFGDAAGLGRVQDLAFEVAPDLQAVGRAGWSDSPELAMSVVSLWADGTIINLQSQNLGPDIVELARSLRAVTEPEWLSARKQVEANVEAAVNAVLDTIGSPPVVTLEEPLPHFTLPEPWTFEWVTDKTIWTSEQHAQSAAFSAAMRPQHIVGTAPVESVLWFFGVDDTPEDHLGPFAPDILVSVSRFEEEPTDLAPTNYDQIDVWGLQGHTYPGSATIEIHHGLLRIWIEGVEGTSEMVHDFVASTRLAGENPLQGIKTDGTAFAPLAGRFPQQRPPGWHAVWTHPDGGRAAVSIWRLDANGLRWWLWTRGQGLAVPDDIWTALAEQREITFGPKTYFDPATETLYNLHSPNVTWDNFEPVELEDWIELVAPYNTDPLKPR